MGAKLLKYYEWLKQEGGLAMQMRLAMKTSLPSSKAGIVPDTPDVTEKFYAACKEIAGKEPPRY